MFVVSDQLARPNVRPLDAYLGFTGQDNDIRAIGRGIQVKTSSVNTANLMMSHTGPQVAAYSDPVGQDQAETTLPPWDVGSARTVNLYEEDGDAEASSGGALVHGSVGRLSWIVF